MKQITIHNQPVIQLDESIKEYFIPDYFISINPHKINVNDELLFKTYKDSVSKFYRKKLGKNFYKKLSQQFNQMFVVEFGNPEKKQITPHLHILLQSKGEDVYDFVRYVMERLKQKYNPDINLQDYNIQKITELDYESKLKYMLKEECSKFYTHNDLRNNQILTTQPKENECHLST